MAVIPDRGCLLAQPRLLWGELGTKNRAWGALPEVEEHLPHSSSPTLPKLHVLDVIRDIGFKPGLGVLDKGEQEGTRGKATPVFTYFHQNDSPCCLRGTSSLNQTDWEI